MKPMMFMELALIVLGATQRQETGMEVKPGKARSSPVPPDRIGFVLREPEIREWPATQIIMDWKNLRRNT